MRGANGCRENWSHAGLSKVDRAKVHQLVREMAPVEEGGHTWHLTSSSTGEGSLRELLVTWEEVKPTNGGCSTVEGKSHLVKAMSRERG